MHQDRRRQRDEAAGEEAVQRADDDHGRDAVRRDQAERQHTGHHGAGDDHVERAGAVRDEIGNDAAEDRAGVQDRQEVKGRVFVRDVGLDGVGLHVEEDDVEAHESQEIPEDEECIRRLFEGGQVQELAARVGNRAHAKRQVGDAEAEESDESDDASSPGEADCGLQAVEDDGVDDAA